MRRMSPAPSCSSRRTSAPTSPGRSSTSTAACSFTASSRAKPGRSCTERQRNREDEMTATLSNAPSLTERAYRIRRNALRMGEVQGQGYIAQALGVADVLAVSYFHALQYRSDEPEWEERDRFLLSIG